MEGTKEVIMYTCVVCGKKFKDTWEHTSVNKSGLHQFKDKAHAEYMQKIMEGDKETGIGSYGEKTYEGVYGYKTPCFCGGHISIRGGGTPDGGAWWESTCDKCDFLYDED